MIALYSVGSHTSLMSTFPLSGSVFKRAVLLRVTGVCECLPNFVVGKVVGKGVTRGGLRMLGGALALVPDDAVGAEVATLVVCEVATPDDAGPTVLPDLENRDHKPLREVSAVNVRRDVPAVVGAVPLTDLIPMIERWCQLSEVLRISAENICLLHGRRDIRKGKGSKKKNQRRRGKLSSSSIHSSSRRGHRRKDRPAKDGLSRNACLQDFSGAVSLSLEGAFHGIRPGARSLRI